jgi:outer membrane protein assembly factor BamB
LEFPLTFQPFKNSTASSFRLLRLLALVTVLAACSAITEIKTSVNETIFGRVPTDPPEPLLEFKSTKTAKILWQVKTGKAEAYEFSPMIEGDYVYAASAEGEIVKVDVNTGKTVWRVDAKEKLSGGVGSGGGLVLVGAENGSVLAFNQAGKAVWKSHLSSEVLSAPQYDEGTVIVRTGDSRIYGINADDGSRKWVYERTTPALSLRSSAGVVVDNEVVYAGFAGGKLIAIRADNGKLLWEASVAQPKGVTEIERIADITSLPFVDGPLIYAVAYQGRIAAVDRVTGRVVWNRDISSLNGLSADNAKIFVSHAIGSVYSLEYTTGKTFWRQAELKNRQLTTPLAINDVVAVGDLEGYVHFLDREDGAQTVRIRTDDSPVMPRLLKLKEDALVAQTRDGSLFAIQVK